MACSAALVLDRMNEKYNIFLGVKSGTLVLSREMELPLEDRTVNWWWIGF